MKYWSKLEEMKYWGDILDECIKRMPDRDVDEIMKTLIELKKIYYNVSGHL